jgi:hypothetical protein
MDGALVLWDRDVLRILYFGRGVVVGAGSNVGFERIARILGRAKVLDAEQATALEEREKAEGIRAAAMALAPEVLKWALERRAYEIAVNLPLMNGAHFLFVEGSPQLAPLPRISIPPMDLAMEGLRSYDEWRNGSAAPQVPVATPVNGARSTRTADPRDPTPRRGRAIEEVPIRG